MKMQIGNEEWKSERLLHVGAGERRAMTNPEHERERGAQEASTGSDFETGSARYPVESEGSRLDPDRDGSGSEGSRIDPDRDGSESEGSRLDPQGDGSDRPTDSEGDQIATEGSQSSINAPSPDSPSPDSGERTAPDFVQSMARAAAQKERDERRRAPGIWMPGPEDLDRDPEPRDDTEFGTDGPPREYTSRQLGIRLRPQHFERLIEAAALYGVRPTTMARMMIVRGINAIHDAELRARARELLESGSE